MTESDPAPLAGLPPGARFAVRVFSRDAGLERVAAWLHGQRSDVEKHLRVAARAAGLTAPGPGADEAAWRDALAPLLASAAGPAPKPPSTRCPSPSVLAAVASGELDGPLLLAQIDHVADCDPCLAFVLDPPSQAPEESPPPKDKAGCLGLLIVAIAVGLGGWLAV